jgi:regulator of protease activity HflC (stomatin/prohibitin superfamily)
MPSDSEARNFALGCCCFCIVFITSCILLGVSFDIIEPTEMGIAFDGNVQHLESDKVYGEGRYLIGLGRSFIKFPITYQTVRYGTTFSKSDGPDIVARTKEGLPISLEVSFQFVLPRNSAALTRLYLDAGEVYQQFYGRICQKVIRDIAAKYPTFDFFKKRREIADHMHDALRVAMKRFYAEVPSLELVNMEINPAFAQAIEATQIAYQDIQQSVYEQNVEVVQAEAAVEVAKLLKEVTLVTAEADAESHVKLQEAQADALVFRVARQTESLLELKDKLNFTNNDDLLAYVWLNTIHENHMQDVVLGLSMPQNIDYTI